MKTVILVAALLVAADVAAQEPRAPIAVSYDRITDYTRVVSDTSTIAHNVRFTIGYGHPGRQADAPIEWGVLVFRTTWRSWRFLEHRDVVLLLDDSIRIRLGAPEHMGVVADGYVVENLLLSVPRALLEQIAGAQTVEGRVGIMDFTLTPFQLNTIRSMVSLMGASTPPASTPTPSANPTGQKPSDVSP